MEDHGRRARPNAPLVDEYFEGRARRAGSPRRSESWDDGTWRVHAVVLLLAHGFPEHLIHEVVCCSEKDARALVDAVRLHLPDADAMNAFLGRKAPRPKAQGDDSGLSLSESEDVKQALNMLEYWTDHWLQEYQGKP